MSEVDERVWAADNPPSRRWPLYSRGNVGEVFPDVVYPLTWTVLGHQAELGWRDAFRDFGLVVDGDFGDEDWVILGVFGGYCYINASYVRILGVRTPGLDVETIDHDFFGESDAPPYVSRAGDKNLRASLRLGRQLVKTLFAKRVAGLDEDDRAVRAFLAHRPSAGAVDQELVDYILGYKPLFRELFGRHILTSFRGTIGIGLLSDLCAKVGRPDLVVSLIGGLGEVESAEPSIALWALGRQARTGAVAAEYDAGLDGIEDRIAASDDAAVAEFRVGIEQFMERHGFRGPNEWDLASQTWDAVPRRVHAAIDRMRHADPSHDPVEQRAKLDAAREEATRTVRGLLTRVDRAQFDKALASLTLFSRARERTKTSVIRSHHGVRLALRELTARTAARGGVDSVADLCLLTEDEFRSYVLEAPEPFAATIAERRAQYQDLSARVPPFVFEGEQPPPEQWEFRDGVADAAKVGTALTGIAGCPGTATGRARIVHDPADPGALGPGDVLVAPITDPSWTPLFLSADAIVVDVGATMSHAVIVSRELGIPCVVSVTGATRIIPDGARVEVDGNAGTVKILEV